MAHLLDRDALAAYLYQRGKDRSAALLKPLARGISFQLTLSPPTAPSTSVTARRLSPSLSNVFGISTTWYLHSPLQSGLDKNSQVWLASLTPPEANDVGSNSINIAEAENYIVLKIIQDSLRELSWASYNVLAFRRREELVPIAIQAYNIMEDFQGSTLPYFFGSTTSTAPSGEEISLMAFEYLPGPTLESIEANLLLPGFAKWNSWMGFEPLAKSVADTMDAAHARGILHNDPKNMANYILDSGHNRLVIIDWESCLINRKDHEGYIFGEEHQVITTLVTACHRLNGVGPWVDSVYPDHEFSKEYAHILNRGY